ncbi:MAG: hypothetical protein HGA80_07555 [Candidatus Omnitrophica bacterium]|nr:hypothetical protein [Candidatus Omnitrophota bacterium]
MRFERASNKHLGELLVERGSVTRDQLNEALEYQKKTPGILLGEVLVMLHYATEEDIAQALTCQYGFPFLPLANYEIEKEVLAMVPLNLCEQFCLIPVDRIGKSLTLAMANPLNVKAMEDVELLTGCAVQAFVSPPRDIKEAIKRYYGNA